MKKRLICLEFNELCPPLLEQWIREGKLPNFARFYTDAAVFTATADEEDHEKLDPWIQWYSIHTGLSCARHGVRHLVDGPKAGHNDIWRMLIANGRTVFNCGSMNARAFQSPGSFFIPDPWCTSQPPTPNELSVYHSFVANRVQGSIAPGGEEIKKSDTINFLMFMLSHGLSIDTISSVGKQVLAEKTSHDNISWRRVTLLDRLQMDVFEYYWHRYKPDFSTFFLNSTAHFQHAYWHCAFPEQMQKDTTSKEIARHQNTILYGYQQMDALLDRFFKMEKEGAIFILTTALSQYANVESSDRYYRPRDMRWLLGKLSIQGGEVSPVMSQQYNIQFSSQAEADIAQKKLAALKVAGKQIFDFSPAPKAQLFFGCGLHIQITDDAIIDGMADQPLFFDVFNLMKTTKSGRHHPDSVLWFKGGNHFVSYEKVSILDILPTILDYYGVLQKVDPHGEFEGTSLSKNFPNLLPMYE